jgi:hypothetical protein
MGNYDLLTGEWMPPLLVAPGSADPQEAVMAGGLRSPGLK